MKKIANLTTITIKEENITDFSAVRNRELARAKTEWVLFLDSDETVSGELEEEIAKTLQNPRYSAYRLHRTDSFLGRELKHGENGNNRFVRLARRDWGEWTRPVHEVWLARRSLGEGGVGNLKNPLFHQLGSVSELLEKINYYSTLEAEYRYQSGKHSSLLHIALLPPAKFGYNYILRLGILDGVQGTIMAIMMSLHSFLTWTKLFLLHQKQS